MTATQFSAGTDTPVWPQLETHARRLCALSLRALAAADASRFAGTSATTAGIVLDYSRQRLDGDVLRSLEALADATHLRERIAAMYRGDHINQTENRAVLHTALRRPRGASLLVGGRDLMAEVLAERERMLDFATAVREGKLLGSAGQPFSLVVNIGIGGSDLGPAMAVQALRNYTAGAPRCAFVSNVDGCHLADVLEHADPARTLFIICSKTFTTLETLSNARVARAWLKGGLSEAAVPAHFAAVSVNRAAMDEFRVHPDYRFAMWDWVGGRYSIWSSIGVSLAIAIGRGAFESFLAGAHAIDTHFALAPWRANLPALLGLIGVWNVNFLNLPSHAVLPYDERLARFPAYLQQLEMESNGKSVRMDATPVGVATGAVVWGAPGNNAQHSFFQLLHQGTPRAALDFLLPARSSCGSQAQQDLAIANCLAQAEAFAYGQPAANPHRVHEGNRPASLLLFEQLDPATLGKLIALYEHKVFTQSVVWGVNAFDQWGVELGKNLCEAITPLVSGTQHADSASLQGTLDIIRPWRAVK
ncbi:MAG: glucose-6-phosphate isomerase [Steroidobacteraceae bacterium]